MINLMEKETKSKMIKVAIADDHTIFVDGIESILKGEEDLKVIGRCYDGPSIVSFVEEH